MRPSTPPPEELPLQDLLMLASRGLRRGWAQALPPWDVSPHHARALRAIGDLDTPRLGDLAEQLRIAPRSATEVVDALEARGLVAREPDSRDRRATVVRLTHDGVRLLREFHAARQSDAETYFAVLTEDQRAQLRDLLVALDAGHRSHP